MLLTAATFMIQILPLHDNEILARINEKENTKAELAYCLYEQGEIGGYVLYTLNSDEGIIKALSAENESIADGLIRAVFGSLYDFGINRAVFCGDFDSDMLEKLSLVEKNTLVTPEIDNVIFHCKHCNGGCH